MDLTKVFKQYFCICLSFLNFFSKGQIILNIYLNFSHFKLSNYSKVQVQLLHKLFLHLSLIIVLLSMKKLYLYL